MSFTSCVREAEPGSGRQGAMVAGRLCAVPRPLSAAKKPDGDFICETDPEPEGAWMAGGAGTPCAVAPHSGSLVRQWASGAWGCPSLRRHQGGMWALQGTEEVPSTAAPGSTTAMPQPSAPCFLGAHTGSLHLPA